MGETAGEDTAEHALGIIRGIVGHRPEIPGDKVKMRRDVDGGRTDLASHLAEGTTDITI
jgi:hypothetical protein